MNNKLINKSKIIVIVLLLWALMPFNPYGYYIFLRIICFLGFGFMALDSYQNKKTYWVILNIIIAILYNPIIKINLDREIWSVINIISAICIGLSMINTKGHIDE